MRFVPSSRQVFGTEMAARQEFVENNRRWRQIGDAVICEVSGRQHHGPRFAEVLGVLAGSGTAGTAGTAGGTWAQRPVTLRTLRPLCSQLASSVMASSRTWS